MSNRIAYLDNNATTRVAPEVVEKMMPYFCDLYGNPSSMHEFGGQVAAPLAEARASVAALLGAQDPSEVIFTSCGTEANNTAIFGGAAVLGPQATIITSQVEHPAVLEPCRVLKEQGHEVIRIGVDTSGNLRMDELEKALQAPGPKLATFMWANNETGVIFPIAQIADMVHKAGGIMHTDAVQATGKLAEVDMSRVGVDMLSISGHKLHAPKGIGALYVRKGTRFLPFMRGGHQERGRRAGTENVPYIIGLGEAARLASEEMKTDPGRISKLRDRLEAGLLASCPDSRVNGDVKRRLPNTSNVSFEYIEGEAMLYHLSDAGICASSGSACTSGSLEPSHVIRSMGVPFTAVHGSIRFSLSRYNTDEDIDLVLSRMPPIVEKLRRLSPFVK